eukprot:GEMP01034641.1.p1 GENE.GEMP01034641.1~~GEMP01034641.1.p1  ORF type:complete len:116 (+),score=11.20 GEMP01034641.1:37-348(+)
MGLYCAKQCTLCCANPKNAPPIEYRFSNGADPVEDDEIPWMKDTISEIFMGDSARLKSKMYDYRAPDDTHVNNGNITGTLSSISEETSTTASNPPESTRISME